MDELRVLKFGGSSVASAGRIRHVAGIVSDACKNGKVIVVVSAMGGTTDYLLKLARQCSPQPVKRELDLLLSTGEQVSIALLAMTLNDMGVAAKSLTGPQVGILTESIHTNARIVDIKKQAILDRLENFDALIVAGFQGVNSEGDVTTLGRGGSDTTAVALAAAVNAVVCDIYTDVDGIYTADPRVVPDAVLLARVSYAEVLEMSRLGAKVIHPRAVELARQYSVNLRVRNTFKPQESGTLIAGGEMEIFRAISSVAVDKDQAAVAIMDVPDQPGIAARIAGALAAQNIGIDMIMQSFHPTIGHNSLTFTVHQDVLADTRVVLEKLKGELRARDVQVDSDCAKVSLIGAGLMEQPDIPARLFAALGGGGINIKLISSSEVKISCIVARAESERAALIIHEAFDLDKVQA
ncbi:MAG: aspartate kinase [Candidatus Obscuribacterales bacterium]|nr:aspartate kinase [Candidatus Obscuribacterales bacterium]